MRSGNSGGRPCVLPKPTGPAKLCKTPASMKPRSVAAADIALLAGSAVKLWDKAQLTGGAFSDFSHHQTGIARNEVELPLTAHFNGIT